jgi:hypothetical protein
MREKRWTGDELVSMLEEFEAVLQAAGLAPSSVDTYMKGARKFVLWLRGEWMPRGPNSVRR